MDHRWKKEYDFLQVRIALAKPHELLPLLLVLLGSVLRVMGQNQSVGSLPQSCLDQVENSDGLNHDHEPKGGPVYAILSVILVHDEGRCEDQTH